MVHITHERTDRGKKVAQVTLKPKRRQIDERLKDQADPVDTTPAAPPDPPPKPRRTYDPPKAQLAPRRLTMPTDPRQRPQSRLRAGLGLQPSSQKASQKASQESFVKQKKAYKRLTVDVSPDTHKALMKYCLDMEISMKRFVESLIEEALTNGDNRGVD